jgi:hypothetical protein
MDTNETHPSRRILRSVGAVLAGLLANVIPAVAADAALHAAGVFPPPGQPMDDARFLLAAAHRVVWAVLGGYVVATLAPARPMRHALVLGLVGFLMSLAGAVATWNRGPEFGPKWYPLAIVAFAVPCTLLGAWLRARQVRARSPMGTPTASGSSRVSR